MPNQWTKAKELGITLTVSDETKKKLSLASSKQRHTEETKKKMLGPKTSDHKKKLSIAKQGKNNPMFGKKQSPESCEKRSNALKGRIPWNKGIKRGTKSIIGESKGTEIFERAGNPLNQRSKN